MKRPHVRRSRWMGSLVAITAVVTIIPALGGLATTAGAASSKSTIVLGEIGDDSGPIGQSYEPNIAASKAWEAYVNANGGLNGHPVKIVFGNDNNNVATGVSLATTMVTNDHVDAMIGLHGEDTEPNLLSYLGKHKIPAVEANTELPDYQSSVAFNPTTGTNAEFADEDKMLKKLSPSSNKLAIIYCAEVSACVQQADVVKADATAAGLKVVYMGAADFEATSYLPQLLAAKQAGAQVISSIMDAPSTVEIVENAASQSWYPYVAGAPTAYESDENPGSSFPAKGHLVVPSLVAPYTISPSFKPYITAIAKYQSGQPTGQFGAGTWASGVLLQTAAKSFPKDFGSNVSSATITKALLSLKGTTLGGETPPLTFPSGSDRLAVNRCIYTVEYHNGTWIAPLGVNNQICVSAAAAEKDS